MIQSRWSQNILLAFVAVVLLLLTVWGWSSGVRAAKSKRTLKDAQAITQGFAEFYKDQNRYPSTVEFDDNNLMRTYISNFPPQQYSTPTCPKIFDYFNPSADTYELRFCLSKSVDSYVAGWNTLKP